MTPLIPALLSQEIALSPCEAPLRVNVRCPGLPLAVYREISAHLRQCAGIDATVLPQTATAFHYGQSQVGGLRIDYDSDAAQFEREQVKAILQYYGQRYGAWELIGEN